MYHSTLSFTQTMQPLFNWDDPNQLVRMYTTPTMSVGDLKSMDMNAVMVQPELILT